MSQFKLKPVQGECVCDCGNRIYAGEKAYIRKTNDGDVDIACCEECLQEFHNERVKHDPVLNHLDNEKAFDTIDAMVNTGCPQAYELDRLEKTFKRWLQVLEMHREGRKEGVRTVYSCPICGWESFDEDAYETDCGQTGCEGKLTQVRKELFDE